MRVVPVAGHDSMLMNLSGAHGPFFTRNLLILTDSAGHTGVGEVPGGEKIRQTLEDARGLIVGQPIGRHNAVLNSLRSAFAGRDSGGRGQQTFDLRVTIHAVTAVEAALLDLLGQFLEVPVAALLGEGQQRDAVQMLGYLFYVGDRKKTDLPYESDPWCRQRLVPPAPRRSDDARSRSCAWPKPRTRATASPTSSSRAACCAARKKSRRFAHCTSAFRSARHARPERRLAAAGCDPPVPRPARRDGLCRRPVRRRRRVLGPRGDGRVPPRHGPAHRHQHGRHRLARDGAQPLAAIGRHPAGRSALLDLQGSVRVAQLCQAWGLTWGSHSNNHFDVSLAMFTHVAAAAPGKVTAIDTHWIWQDGQRLTKAPLQIEEGFVKVPTRGGLGIELDMAEVEKAHQLYLKHGLGARNDAQAMQYLIPNWTFDNKRPCMVR
jgi:glucarate dehydratase